MFTGIVEEVGLTKEIKSDSIEIECSKVLENTQIGDSICVNGVCQTVTEISKNAFKARLSVTTRDVTTFSCIKTGDKVNLERALTLSSRLGGHVVLGHVEGVGQIVKINKLSEFFDVFVKIPSELLRYVIKKGSITIDGVSLTVADIDDDIIKLAIIPHTFNSTNLYLKKTGDKVNIETDVFAKYVEKFLSTNNNVDSKITEEFLKENGF